MQICSGWTKTILNSRPHFGWKRGVHKGKWRSYVTSFRQKSTFLFPSSRNWSFQILFMVNVIITFNLASFHDVHLVPILTRLNGLAIQPSINAQALNAVPRCLIPTGLPNSWSRSRMVNWPFFSSHERKYVVRDTGWKIPWRDCCSSIHGWWLYSFHH